METSLIVTKSNKKLEENVPIKKIRHCSRKVINGSRQFDVTKENIDKMMNYQLFEFENYCGKCFDIIPMRPTAQRERIIEILKLEETK